MNQLFNKQKKAKTYLPLGDQLVKEIYINRSQKLDVHGEAGVESYTAELRKQDWIFKKKKATKLMSLYGRAAMYYLYINGDKFADVARVQSVTKLAGWVMEAFIYSNRLHTIDGQTYPVTLRFHFEKDHYVLNRQIINESGETIIIGDSPEGFHYAVGETPIEILRNNSDETSDIKFYGVTELKDRINYWGKQIGEEWRLAGKARQVNRAMYGDGAADSQFKKRFDPENDTIKQGGINSKLSSDMLPTGGVTGGVGTAATVAGTLSATFRNQVMLHNDTTNTGTNKHGLEIALSQQPSIDALLEQKAERDRAYSNFLSGLFGTEVSVSINLAPTTQAVIDGMAADLAIKIAQAAINQGGE